MQRYRYIALVTVLGALASVALGQQSPTPQPPAPSGQRPTPPAQAPAPAGAAAPAQAGGAAPAPTPAPAGTPPAATPSEPQQRNVKEESFIPTEELSADEEVTFPIDI